MNPVNFLIDGLNQISRNFPQTKLRLGKGNMADEYLVDVNPGQMLDENSDFRSAANSLLLDFYQDFDCYSLAFLSVEDFTKIEEVLYEWSNGVTNPLEEYALEAGILKSLPGFLEAPQNIDASRIAYNFGAQSVIQAIG